MNIDEANVLSASGMLMLDADDVKSTISRHSCCTSDFNTLYSQYSIADYRCVLSNAGIKPNKARKKEEFIDRLKTGLLSEPVLYNILLPLSPGELSFTLSLASVGRLALTSDLSFVCGYELQEKGLCMLVVDDSVFSAIMPEELRPAVETVAQKKEFGQAQAICERVYRRIEAALYLYGVLDYDAGYGFVDDIIQNDIVYGLNKDNTPSDLAFLRNTLEAAHLCIQGFFTDHLESGKVYLSHPGVIYTDELFDYVSGRTDIERFQFSNEELLQAENPPLEREKAYESTFANVIKAYLSPRLDLDVFMADIRLLTKEDNGNNAIQFIMSHCHFDNKPQIQTVLDAYMQWTNHVPKWTIKGHAPQELFADKASMKEKASPGRNDPCPCGSGIKYKNCCAKKLN